MSWPTGTVRGDFDADKPYTTTEAEALDDRDKSTRTRGGCGDATINYAESTTTATGDNTVATQKWWVTENDEGKYLYHRCQAKVSAGTGYWKIRDDTNGVDGTEVSVTRAAYDNFTEFSKVLLTNGREEISVVLRCRVDNGANTVYVRNTDGLTTYTKDT